MLARACRETMLAAVATASAPSKARGSEWVSTVDARTRAVNEILAAGRDQLGLGSLTPDGRWIYFARTVNEADLWRISWD